MMPNYEFYAQIYMQSRQQQYTASYNAAYRDLMAEYKEEVRVQNLMAEMLVADQRALARTRSGSRSGKSTEYLAKVEQAQRARNVITYTEKGRVEAIIKKNYAVDGGTNKIIDEVIGAVGYDGPIKGRWQERNVKYSLGQLSDEQRKALMLKWEGEMMSRYGLSKEQVRKEYFMENDFAYDMNEHNRLMGEEERDEHEKIDNTPGYGLPNTAEKEMLRQYWISERTATAATTTGTVKTEPLKSIAPVGYEFGEIAVPTEQDILARAAGYYAPSAGGKFQASMEEISTERESSAQARKAEKAQLAEDLKSLPDWAGRVYKVQGDTEAIIDVDDAELTSAPQKWARLHMDTGKYYADLPGSIAAIDKQFPDDALAQSQALTMLMALHVRRRRTKAAGDVDLVEQVEE